MDSLFNYVKDFRLKIDEAAKRNLFSDDVAFKNFPLGCCGGTCYLLAEYLLHEHSIETIYVCGTYKEQSHAWLVVKNELITMPPPPKIYKISDEVKKFLQTCGEKIDDEKIYYDIQNYEEANLTNGLIIDITADQFGEAPIYVGQIDCFHKKFDFDFAHDYQGINSETCCSDFRLLNLYSIIVSI